jgi:hypothetical protein
VRPGHHRYAHAARHGRAPRHASFATITRAALSTELHELERLAPPPGSPGKKAVTLVRALFDLSQPTIPVNWA